MLLQPTLHLLAYSMLFILPNVSQLGSEGTATRVDSAGDPLPENAVARMGTSRLKHASVAIDVAYSPDGKILASAGRDNLVRLWDPATGKQIRQLAGHYSIVYCVAFSPDGKVIASGSGDCTIRIWEVATGRELRQLRGHANYIGSLDFSSDGKTLASSGGDSTLRLWDPENGRQLRQMLCALGRGTSGTAFSPDGKFVVAGSADMSIRLWEVATGKEVRQFAGHTVLPHSARFSRDGKRLVSGSMEGKIRIWDVDSGGELREIKAVGAVWTVRFSPDGKLIASGGPDCILQLWDAESGKEVRRMTGHAGGVSELAFSPDGKTLASAGHDQTIRLWDVETGASRFPLAGHAGAVPAVAISPRDGRIATGGSDGVVITWDRDTAKEVARFACLESCITALAYSPDGRLLAAAGCRTGRQSRNVIQGDGVVVLDAANGKVNRHFESIHEKTFALAFGRDGRKLSAFCHDGALHTWNIESGEELELFSIGQPRQNMVAAFSADGEKLALADEGSVRLFERCTGKELHSLSASDLGDAPTAITFSPDSRTLAAAGADRNVYVWELLTGRQRATVASRGSFASALTFSPTGWTLAAADIRVRPEGWRSLYSEAGSDTSIHIHDLAGAQAERKLKGHRGTINALVFSRDGRFLFSGSNDCTSVMWDMDAITKDLSSRKELANDQLERLWRDLGSQDAGRAFQAMWRLASAKNAVAFLADHIKPAHRKNDPPRYTRLINQLDAESFDARESAADELEHLGEAAAPALREALQGKPSAATRSRIEDILSKIDGPVTAADRLSALRGLEILEHIAGVEAQKAIEKLAHGAPNERLTEDAKRSLERLTNSPSPK